MIRVLNVVRMQFINRQTYLWVPLLVLGGSLVLSILVFALIPYEGAKWGGGAQAPLWYFLVVGVQALTLAFPFSQGMSVTRREFFLGTVVTAATTSAILATIYVLGGFVEQWTSGWGVNGYFFFIDWVWAAGWGVPWLFFFAIAVGFWMVGFSAATVYKRFGTFALTATLLALGLLLVLAGWLVTRANAWAALGDWISTQGVVGLALWGLLVIAVLGAASFTLLRRATP